jgi:hypothetical protein
MSEFTEVVGQVSYLPGATAVKDNHPTIYRMARHPSIRVQGWIALGTAFLVRARKASGQLANGRDTIG